MSKNIRIARELVRIARMLVAYKHDDEQIGPFSMYVSNKAVGNMRYPGDFICVSGPYNDMQYVKDKLKAIGLCFDGASRCWHVFWRHGNWDSIKAILEDYVKTKASAADESDLQPGDMFDMTLTITKVGSQYRPSYSGMYNGDLTMDQLYAIENWQNGSNPTIKRAVTFTDNETGNVYTSHVSSRQRISQSDKLCREKFDELDQHVGDSIHVVGEVLSVKSYPGKNEIIFKMK